MRTLTLPSLPEGLYRPGRSFSDAELQVMAHEGAMRPLLADIYVCSALPDSPGLRALGCQSLLSGGLRAHAVLCGESAAWVHVGGATSPHRITVITAGVYRRQTAGPIPWQVHQVPLDPAEQQSLHAVQVTTVLRTAADLFLGIGTLASRRPLGLKQEHPGADPRADAGRALRWGLIRRLSQTDPEQLRLQDLVQQISRQSGLDPDASESSRRRLARIEALLRARVFGG